MENKKDIGNAIRNKLEKLDKNPQDQVWGNIREELQKKKKKRRIGFIFFWSKTLGILLVAAVAAFYLYNQNESSNKVSPNSSKELIGVSTDTEGKKTNIDITGNSNSELDPKASSNDSKILNDDKNVLGNNTNTTEGTSTRKNNIIPKESHKSNNLIRNKAGERNSLTRGKNNGSHISSKPKNYFPGLASKVKLKKSKSGIAQKEKIYRNKKSQKENIISAVSEKQSKKEIEVDLSSLQDKSNSAIASEEKEKTKKKDSVAKKQNDKEITINMYPEDSIKKVKEGQYRKFYLDAFVSPTLYGSFSKKSLLDQSLDTLPKKSEIKFSYGFGISYDLSKRFSVRIGFQRVNISYVTKNAFLSWNEIQMLNYDGINYNPNISNETIYNASGIDPNQTFKMDITQKFTYTEIPVEFKYRFLDKKLSIKSSCGFSYLMLNENSISVKTINGFQQQIGKTKDISNTAFSLNLGLELEYPIFKNTSIFAEPMLNYMVKAASSGTYNPYIFGIHTGIRISFNN